MNRNYKIAVYGCGRDAVSLVEFIEEFGQAEILYFVQTEKDKDMFYGKEVKVAEDIVWDELDYVVIASRLYYAEIRQVLENIEGVDATKIIFLFSFLEKIKSFEPQYKTCIVENKFNYIYTKEDMVIAPYMKYTGKNHGDEMMKKLLELSKRFFDFDDTGYFLDIGANIGTASIYAKHLMPQIKVIGFEPGRQNFNLYRCNCILNNMEDIKTEKLGLGDTEVQKGYNYVSDNPGASFLSEDSGEEVVHIVTLDGYLERQGISAKEISFIWMDVEGFESEVIIGAKKTLAAKRIPLVHEFNAKAYIQKNKVDEYCEIMEACYDSFVDVPKLRVGTLDIMPISKLKEVVYSTDKQTDLFFF